MSVEETVTDDQVVGKRTSRIRLDTITAAFKSTPPKDKLQHPEIPFTKVRIFCTLLTKSAYPSSIHLYMVVICLLQVLTNTQT